MNATPTHVFVFIKNKSAYCDAIERTIHRCIRKCKRVQKFRPFVRGHLKTYTVISFHNLYHQPPQLIPISIHNLYHFEGSASTSTTYTINWHQSGITYTIPEISIAELIPILID